MYNEKLLTLCDKPKNVGIIKHADGVGEAGNVESGQLVKLYLKIENDIIIDSKFKAYGNILTIGCASCLTNLVKNMTLDKAKTLTCKDLLNELDLEDTSICVDAEVCIDALLSALINHYSKQIV